MLAIHVAILADVRFYREGLAELLTRHGVKVAGAATDGPCGIAIVRMCRPDIALIDMAMAESMATLRELAQAIPDVRPVAIGLPETEADILACAEAGAVGYVPREGSIDDLIRTLHQAIRGETLCSPRVVASLFRRVATQARERRSHMVAQRLTARECQIVELIHHGLTNRQIAGQLCIEPSTVKNHVHNILEKLQVQRRTEAAAWAAGWTGGR
jgi:two-component system nitrate/nitrite response regulator NarL